MRTSTPAATCCFRIDTRRSEISPGPIENTRIWIDDVAAAATIYTRGNTPTSEGTLTNMPLTVGFTAGQGRVIYTSFHQEPGVDSATARLLQLLMFEL